MVSVLTANYFPSKQDYNFYCDSGTPGTGILPDLTSNYVYACTYILRFFKNAEKKLPFSFMFFS